jgi:N-acetyl sugar amidotransferase
MIRYCASCVMPDTKPDLLLDEQGVCNACRSFQNRKAVNWDVRREELVKVLDRYRSKDGSQWDCVIPVSGGKDSTYQVIRMLQFGMNPLCVTSTTCDLSPVGRENIDNIKRLGVDYIEFTSNRVVRAKLNRIGLKQVGDISWPEHASIFTIPVRVAVQYKVPLLIWGENSQNEYGGPAASAENNVLNRRWLEEFGGLLGLRVSDLIGMDGLERKHLLPFFYPSDEDLKSVGVTGVFLGYYLPWDGFSNALIAEGYGFKTLGRTVEGSIVDYENLDNHHTGIHDYFKFLKFGFGRATDLACLHLRRGRLTRHDAIDLVRRHDGKFPWTYLGKPLEQILEPLDVSVEEFIAICDRFTNKKLFIKDAQGNLLKDVRGNLTKINYDNDEPLQSTTGDPHRLRNGESGVVKTLS